MIFSFGLEAATTAQINLSGSVSVGYDISVSQAGGATSLDIENGENLTNVASVTEITNNPMGYKVSMESQNGGVLVHNSVLTSTVDYDITYDGNLLDLDGSSQIARSEAGAALSPGNLSSVSISFVGLGSNALAGTYSDTLNLEISAP